MFKRLLTLAAVSAAVYFTGGLTAALVFAGASAASLLLAPSLGSLRGAAQSEAERQTISAPETPVRYALGRTRTGLALCYSVDRNMAQADTSGDEGYLEAHYRTYLQLPGSYANTGRGIPAGGVVATGEGSGSVAAMVGIVSEGQCAALLGLWMAGERVDIGGPIIGDSGWYARTDGEVPWATGYPGTPQDNDRVLLPSDNGGYTRDVIPQPMLRGGWWPGGQRAGPSDFHAALSVLTSERRYANYDDDTPQRQHRYALDSGGRDPKWDGSKRLDGLCAVSLIGFSRHQDPFPGAGLTNCEVLVDGLQIEYPDPAGNGMRLEHSRNAAAVWYWYLRNIRRVPEEAINRQAFLDAYAVCDEVIDAPEVTEQQVARATYGGASVTTAESNLAIDAWRAAYGGERRRYTIDGILVSPGPERDFTDIEAALNLAWAGYVRESGGEYFFRPGRHYEPVVTITAEDLIAAPTFQISQAVVPDAADVKMLESVAHDYGPHQRRYTRAAGWQSLAAESADNVPVHQAIDVGDCKFVSHPQHGAVLAALALRRSAQGLMRTVIRVHLGAACANTQVRPGDVVLFGIGDDLPARRWEVQSVQIQLQGQPSVTMGLWEEPAGLWNFDGLADYQAPLDTYQASGGAQTGFRGIPNFR